MHDLYFYGARKSKKGNHANVIIINKDADGNKIFLNIPVLLDSVYTDKPVRVTAKIENGYAYIKIPLLKELAPKEAHENIDKTDDDLPF